MQRESLCPSVVFAEEIGRISNFRLSRWIEKNRILVFAPLEKCRKKRETIPQKRPDVARGVPFVRKGVCVTFSNHNF